MHSQHTKRFVLVLTLVLTLAAAPPALAGPAFGGDIGTSLYGWIADLWHTVTRAVAGDEEELGPLIIPNGARSETGAEFGPMVIPNGSASDSGDEFGPWVIPNGSQSSTGDEYGPWVIPNGSQTQTEDPEDEFGPWVIPNG